MSIADFEELLKLLPIPSQDRSTLKDGYSILLGLGWPTCYINWKMCERAQAALVPRYEGVSSWHAYKREWAWEDNKKQLPS